MATLANRGFEHPGGLGVHAEQELTFALPAVASSFECRVGLDAQASRGGAARARALVDGARRFESPLLVGSQQQASVPAVKLGPRAKRLSLVADMARDAPSGSDPFDIRDLVDWLEPVLRCDPQQLALELERAMPAPVPGWTIEPPAGEAWRLANALDIAYSAARRPFVRGWSCRGRWC